MTKLTSVEIQKGSTESLTSQRKTKFQIAFGKDMEKNYCISKLKGDKKGQLLVINFMIKYVNKDMNEVEQHIRQTDKYDICNDNQVVHYSLSKGARIHGYYAEGIFNVVRIDCNHDKHD